MKKRDKKPDLPLFIIRASKGYYQDTKTGKYIPTNKIDEYVNRLRDTANKKELPVKEYWWNKD